MEKFDPVAALAHPMRGDSGIVFGDTVRVRSTPLTIERALANKVGSVYGQTTASITHVEVIGELTKDYAINVFFEDDQNSVWFAEELLEFVDHGAGTSMEIGTTKMVRTATGEWIKSESSASKPWWKFW